MILQQEKLPSLNINASGSWQLHADWLLQPEKIPANSAESTAWQQAVQNWLPNPGSKWRIPAASASGYSESDEWIVAEVTSAPAAGSSTCTFRVGITAVPGDRVTVNKLTGTKEIMTAQGEHFRSASWLVSENALGDWLPVTGDQLPWAGGNFICREITLKETAPMQWQVDISAVDLAVEPPQEISFRRNHDFETEKYGVWRVHEKELESFKKINDINASAPWAGNSYRITDIKVSAPAAGICRVTLTARDINVRLTGVTRKERFLSFSKKKRPRRKIFWESVWRVHRDHLSRFANITGKSARSWTGCSSIVTASDSRRLSDYEFEYKLEAVPRKNSMFAETDDKSDFSERVDINASVVEMTLFPEQCGWWRDSYGTLKEIPDWSPQYECPFETGEPLPVNLMEIPLKTLQVTETRYFRDKNFSVTAHINTWLAGSRIWYGTVDKQTATWLREEIYKDLAVDDSGETWAKITCVYRLPPAGMQWNAHYWNMEK